MKTVVLMTISPISLVRVRLPNREFLLSACGLVTRPIVVLLVLRVEISVVCLFVSVRNLEVRDNWKVRNLSMNRNPSVSRRKMVESSAREKQTFEFWRETFKLKLDYQSVRSSALRDLVPVVVVTIVLL